MTLSFITLEGTRDFSVTPVADAKDKKQATGLNIGSMVGKYRILGELGRGGMGLVYRALDQEHDRIVALKTLKAMDPDLLHSFKAEFRTISNVSHPNLVALYELVSDGDTWYITMEIIYGTDFLSYVRFGGVPNDDALPSFNDGIDRRLRNTLKQLAIGLNAIHSAGILHRDLKPSNVFVTTEGQVKILDFGLVATLERGRTEDDNRIVGTPSYMSPEQTQGKSAAEPTDWYSVGVMLYEVLTGDWPFRGKLMDVLRRKQSEDPPRPSERAAHIPADLDDLCVGLLQRDPAARPSLEQFFDISPDELTWSAATPGDSLLVGRERQLKVLAECFDSMRQGKLSTVFVEGISGFGKSALVEKFLDDIRGYQNSVVLKGRCYERESVPYKAWDSLVDSLSDFLAELAEHDCQAVVPEDVAVLGRIFPVLKRVPAITNASGRYAELPNQQELRRRAFGALRELLSRVAQRVALILYIDDLQWGDVDSATLLAELLRPPNSPPLMFLGCYRSDEASTSPFLRTLEEIERQGDVVSDRKVITVGPLEHDESVDLATELIGRDEAQAREQAEAVAKEAGGSPFFIAELVRYIQTDATTLADAGGLALDEVLWKRVARCTEDERRLLEIIAVSTQPTEPESAFLAANVVSDGPGLLAMLQSEHFVRTLGSGDEIAIESYHDRVRESVVGHLDHDTLVDHHLRLGTVLEESGDADAERLALHFQEAGKYAKAGAYYETAAEQAANALAFDNAAQFYRSSLELRPPKTTEEKQSLHRNLADALANAGRGREAAEQYLQAAIGDKSTFTIDMQRRAATQYLFGGHIVEGLAALRWVAGEVNLPMPKSGLRSIVPILITRLKLAVRGLKFKERKAGDISDQDKLMMDTCYEAGQAMSIIDPVWASWFCAYGLLLSLRAGEPYRLARQIAMEALSNYVSSTKSDKGTVQYTDKLLDSSEELAKRTTEQHGMGMVYLIRGMTTYIQGCWTVSRDYLYHAEGIFRTHCTGVTWELDTAFTFSLWSLTYMGEIAELKRRRKDLLRESQERGDLYAFANLSTYIMSLDRLASNDPDGAKAELQQVFEQWPHQTGFHVQHHNVILAKSLIDLYSNNGEEAWKRIHKNTFNYYKSILVKVMQVRVDFTQMRARSALQAALNSARPKKWLKRAAKDAKRLRREHSAWAHPFSELVHAGIETHKGNTSDAISRLRTAADQFHELDMKLYAAAANHRLGELLEGEEGTLLMQRACELCRQEQVLEPVKMLHMFAPGFKTPFQREA